MKISHILLLMFFSSGSVFGQTIGDRVIISVERVGDNQSWFLVTDSSTIEMDSIQVRNIDPNWIKSIEVKKAQSLDSVKSETVKVFIELKKRREKRFLKTLNTER